MAKVYPKLEGCLDIFSYPWLAEPDFLVWESDTGLICFILRHPDLKHLCGYVCIGIDITKEEAENFEVHGGVTFYERDYSNEIYLQAKAQGFDLSDWIVGFDCAHAGDLSPGIETISEGSTYKDIEYVKAECENLAKQVKLFLAGISHTCKS